ncbi:MAG: type III-A CRISPR-associated protein Cas10/Csm1 [Pleomorphochaeta sp.]
MIDIKSQYEVAIAALLHDIGKFKQRAYKGDETCFNNTIKQMEGHIAKLNTQTKLYTHRHALWTYDFFINDFKPIIDKINFDIDLDWEKIYISSASHHNPSKDDYSQIIAEADIISSSNDRGDKREAYEKGSYYKKPLRSIFTNINTEIDNKPIKSNYYYTIPKDNKFKYPIEETSDQIDIDYKFFWNSFISKINSFPNKFSMNDFVNKLKDILLEYTWCIPSATNDLYNDISLYDHSVTTMVFALAMVNSTDLSKFKIFAADVSGIQQYIFQSKYSSFKGAAKVFRGRSFIISAISNAYKLALCEKLNIIPFVDLIDAGGKFTFILPNDISLDIKLKEFIKEQELFFFKKYDGSLCVLTYFNNYDIDSFSKEKFVETQKDVGFNLNSKKVTKFINCLEDIEVINNKIDIKGSRCAICGKRIVTNSNYENCDECEKIKNIGAHVLNKSFINFNKYKGYEIVKGVYVSIADQILDENFYSYILGNTNEKYPLWRLNTHSPEDTFKEMAEASLSEDGLGKKFLAYVKIDVDNLGEIFISGFPKEIYTISRYVTLSRLLNQFFNVYVKNILEKDYPEAYTVISGGDDVFIILPWNQAIDFIETLKLKFRLYCCNNKNIHFSTGIVVGHHHEPFALLNEKANIQLDDRAKEREGKNCTSYFNVLFDEKELRILSDDISKLTKFRNEYDLSSSFVYRVYKYVNDILSNDNELNLNENQSTILKNQIREWSVQSKLRYDLIRNIKNDDEEAKIEIFNFFLDHIDNYKNYREIEKFKVALIHTMYEFRE